MARIAGIDLPKNKRGEIGLQYIFGIGHSTAQYILTKANISYDKKVNEWNDEEQTAIRNIINAEFNCVTEKVYLFVANVLRRTHVLVRVSVRQLLVRRK